MHRLFALTTTALLLCACQQAAENPAENAAGNAAAAAPGADSAQSSAAASAPLGAPVSGEEAAKLMHSRHERMEEIGDAMKLVSRELKGSSPDLAKVRQGAATIAELAPQVSGWFPPGTGPDVGKTEAKAEIWQKPEDFAAKTRDLQRAARAFNAAAQGGDLAAIRSAHATLGKTCKACHDPYREEH